MAKLINIENGEEREVKENDCEDLMRAGEELGVVIACRVGVCGVCKVEVVEGAENLNELSEQERDMGFGENRERLLCKCVIKKGTVKIKVQ
ncbi:MAG: 2Fe-2S iron-sulfur cluster-binding protein [Nanoarchaeota archaeon]|nr:2Fe-2S iron-sulfur cluster-binding protein [Nanoarchaeota archaeon]